MMIPGICDGGGGMGTRAGAALLCAMALVVAGVFALLAYLGWSGIVF